MKQSQMALPAFNICFLLLLLCQAIESSASIEQTQDSDITYQDYSDHSDHSDSEAQKRNLSDTTVLIIIVLIGAVAITLSGIIASIYYRVLQNRRSQMRIGIETATNLNLDPELQPLSPQNLDQRFPKVEYDKIENNTLAQTTCSVCLEDMETGAACRQLYCKHIFHSDCIQLWLINRIEKGQSVSCPNCNRDVSLIPTGDTEKVEDV